MRSFAATRRHRSPRKVRTREQQTLPKLFSQSVMPKLLLTNEGPPKSTVDAAYQFWHADLSQGTPSKAQMDQSIACGPGKQRGVQ